MKSKIVFIPFLILLLLDNVYPQYQNVMISNQYFPAETSVAINPINPNQVVAASNIWFLGDAYCAYYNSTNGGLNWSSAIFVPSFGKIYCDPGLAADKLGNFFFTCDAGGYSNPPPNLNYLYCMRSTNGGINWATDTFATCFPKMADMPTVCVDMSNSIYQNNIYVVYTLADTIHSPNSHLDSSNAYFCRSTDHGLTFSVPKRISSHGGIGIGFYNSYLEGCVVCAGPEGEVYAAWADSLGIFFNRSTDAGVTWLDNEMFISQLAGGWTNRNVGACGYTGTPWIDCDVSNSPYKGTVYLSWTDTSAGLHRKDIWLVKSTNQGTNWSQMIRINDDPVNVSSKVHFFTHLAVDQANGNLYCAFYDNRNYPSSTGVLDLFLARSTDGGNTFANIKINSNPFILCPYGAGDYIGLAAYNNKVRAVWTQDYSNSTSVWTAIVDTFLIGIQPISTVIPKSFDLFQNYPNPFNPRTKIKFDVTSPNKGLQPLVQLKIYDILGREIATLVNELLKPGSYEVDWDASNYPSGVYFYKLISGDFIATRKMVLLK